MFQGDSVDTRLLEPEEMAKKKAAKKRDPAEVRPLVTLKGNQYWYDWLKEFADSRGLNVTGVIDEALRDHAEAKKFVKPMPRRA